MSCPNTCFFLFIQLKRIEQSALPIKSSEAVIFSRLCPTGEGTYVTSSDLHRYVPHLHFLWFTPLWCVLGGARRSITSEQSSVWYMINHGFSRDSHVFLCLQSIPGVTVQWPCPQAVCKFTMVSTTRPYIPAASFVLALAATLAVLWKWSFSFFSGINVMQPKWAFHIVLAYPDCEPTTSGMVRQTRSICQYCKPVFTVSFILVLHGKRGPAKSKSVRKVHKWPKVIRACCCSLLLLYFQHLLHWLSCQWFLYFLKNFPSVLLLHVHSLHIGSSFSWRWAP